MPEYCSKDGRGRGYIMKNLDLPPLRNTVVKIPYHDSYS